MTYIQSLQYAFQLFRTKKQIWILGVISLAPILINQFVPTIVREYPFLVCIYFPVDIFVLVLSVIAEGAAIYLVYQATEGNSVTFSQAWHQSRAKVFRIFGLVLISVPTLFIVYFIIFGSAMSGIIFPIRSFVAFLGFVFLMSYSIFGICSIMINNEKVFAAAWKSFLTTSRNFFKVIVFIASGSLVRLIGIVLIVSLIAPGSLELERSIAWAVYLPGYQSMTEMPIVALLVWMIDLFINPMTWIILTLIYLGSTEEKTKSVVSSQQVTT